MLGFVIALNTIGVANKMLLLPLGGAMSVFNSLSIARGVKNVEPSMLPQFTMNGHAI